jgi:hypothetical protein
VALLEVELAYLLYQLPTLNMLRYLVFSLLVTILYHVNLQLSLLLLLVELFNKSHFILYKVMLIGILLFSVVTTNSLFLNGRTYLLFCVITRTLSCYFHNCLILFSLLKLAFQLHYFRFIDIHFANWCSFSVSSA